jgi:putative component of toxin-antitoxin plasmid stabilization module
METNTYLEIVHVGRGAKLYYAPRNSVVTCCGKWNVHQSYSTTATVDCKKCIETVEELKRWQK